MQPTPATVQPGDEVAAAARVEAIAASWRVLREAVQHAGSAMEMRVWELLRSDVGVQPSWDIARSEVLPKWIPRIEAANDAILLLTCTDAEAAPARRRSWVRCRASAGLNQGRLTEDAPAALDADLWVEDRWRAGDTRVAWLAPLFEVGAKQPGQWQHLRSDFGDAALALRTEQALSRLAATKRQANKADDNADDKADDLNDERVRAAMKDSERRLTRWREHNARYLIQLCAPAVEAGHAVDALVLQCMFVHAENPALFGESSAHADALVAAKLFAAASHPAREEELAFALLTALDEYRRSTEAIADSILASDRRFRSWLAGAKVFDQEVLDAVERSQRMGEAREQLMVRQRQLALQWLVDDPQCEIAVNLRELEASAEMDSWAVWRFVLHHADGWLRSPLDQPREAPHE